jgi:hypothetical protein
MARAYAKETFWTSLPGVLTAAAALVGALGALILAMHQFGISWPTSNPSGQVSSRPGVAELVTTDGLLIRFDAKHVEAIADHDDVGKPQTSVYGIMPGALQIPETVPGFIARIGLNSKLVQFTRPSGTAIWINVDAVGSLRPRIATDIPTVNTVINIGSRSQGIKETISVVTAALNAHGGNF